MKLYDFTPAPNPRRVRIFLAEKGINLPSEQVNILEGKGRTPEMLAKNPAGGLPVLELDDGTCLAESVAICRYIEGLHPEPNLMGKDFREQAFIEMWNRRMEMNLFGAVARAFQNTHPLMKSMMQQFPEYGAAQLSGAHQQVQWLDGQIGSRQFVAGDRFTIADITAFVAMDFGQQLAGLKLDPAAKNVSRWFQAVASRPSAKV